MLNFDDVDYITVWPYSDGNAYGVRLKKDQGYSFVFYPVENTEKNRLHTYNILEMLYKAECELAPVDKVFLLSNRLPTDIVTKET